MPSLPRFPVTPGGPPQSATCGDDGRPSAVGASAGSGIIGQHRVGLPAAATLSILADAGWAAMGLGDRRWQRALAVGAGTAMAAPALHYTLFPWQLRFGLPVLEEAEGLEGWPLAVYVALLYAWGISGVAATRQLPRHNRRWTLAGVGLAVAFRQLALAHLIWIRAEVARNPQWWNRAWVPQGSRFPAALRSQHQ